MKTSAKIWPLLCASALLLTGCMMGGMQGGAYHLSPTQCRDLTELRNHAPLTRQRNSSELAALEAAGYDPSLWFDPYYPDDLQQAQQQVDIWYQADCQPMPMPMQTQPQPQPQPETQPQ